MVIQGDDIAVTVAGETLLLEPAPAASGATYEAVNDPTTTFWSKGDKALLVLRGYSCEECE